MLHTEEGILTLIIIQKGNCNHPEYLDCRDCMFSRECITDASHEDKYNRALNKYIELFGHCNFTGERNENKQ